MKIGPELCLIDSIEIVSRGGFCGRIFCPFSSDDDALDGIHFDPFMGRWTTHLATVAVEPGAFTATLVAGHLGDLRATAVLARTREAHVARSPLKEMRIINRGSQGK